MFPTFHVRCAARPEFKANTHSIKSVDSSMVSGIGSRGSPYRGSDVILWRPKSGPIHQWNDDFTTKVLLRHQFQLVLDVGGGRFAAESGVCAWIPSGWP
jgi:hypothetical protein